MATPEQFASGGIIPGPTDHGDDIPAILSPGCPAEWAHPRPRRFWHYPARDLTHPRAFQILRATDEFHNPTLAVGLPWVGMWVLAYPRRLNTVLCGAECQEPTCEVAAFYRSKET